MGGEWVSFILDLTFFRSREEEEDEAQYTPQFVTSGDTEKSTEEKEAEVNSDIWDLAKRSNKNNPKQDIGRIVEEPEKMFEPSCPHAKAARTNKLKQEHDILDKPVVEGGCPHARALGEL